jgi:Antitoxin Phd_YefM, type II toxin-antitoxin system
VTRHGKPVAVVIPVEEYRRLRTRGKSLKALLAAAPLERENRALARYRPNYKLVKYLIDTNVISDPQGQTMRPAPNCRPCYIFNDRAFNYVYKS